MNDKGEMQTVEKRIPMLEGRTMFRWPRFLLENVLAIGGSLVVTGFISLFQLYPKIPNISFIYLLVILLFASTLGSYTAVLASVTAFFAFDYFLVPPLYTFTIARWEEWIALFVFLVTALLTSQLSAVMRKRTDQAQRQVRETRILYELLRFANTYERSEELLTPMAVASSSNESFSLSADELILATATMNEGQIKEKRSAPPPDIRDSEHNINYYANIGPVTLCIGLSRAASSTLT